MKPRLLVAVVLIVGIIGLYAFWRSPKYDIQTTMALQNSTAIQKNDSRSPGLVLNNQDKPSLKDKTTPVNVVLPLAPLAPASNPAPVPAETVALPMRFATVSSEVSQIALASITRHLRSGSGKITLSPPIGEYILGFRESLDQAKPKGFFFIGESSGNVAAAADMPVPDGSDTYGSRHLAVAPPYAGATAIAAAIEQLASLPQVRAGSYEIRLLSIPCPPLANSSVFDVVWLKSDTGQPDLIYQLPGGNSKLPLPYHLEVGKLYLGQDFEKIILTAPVK